MRYRKKGNGNNRIIKQESVFCMNERGIHEN